MITVTLLCHDGCDGVSNRQPHDCLLNRSFRCRSKKTSKLRVTGLCERNSPVIGEFPAQKANNAENVSIWWRHHVEIEIFFFHVSLPGYQRFCVRFVDRVTLSKMAEEITRSLASLWVSNVKSLWTNTNAFLHFCGSSTINQASLLTWNTGKRQHPCRTHID